MRIYYSCLSHPGSTKLQFKSISCLPWQNKRDGSQIQYSGMLYIIFDWKAVCSMQNHGLFMFHSFISLAPGILKVHVIHAISISISSYDFAVCILPFYSFTSHQKFRSPYVSERKKTFSVNNELSKQQDDNPSLAVRMPSIFARHHACTRPLLLALFFHCLLAHARTS